MNGECRTAEQGVVRVLAFGSSLGIHHSAFNAMAFLGPNNALAWAHFRLRGGWPRSFAFTGGAVVILVMLIIGAVRLNPIEKPRILYGWTTGLLALQAAVLVMYIPGRISAAVRQDIQSKLIES